MAKKLTPKQRKFKAEYLKDPNATKAAIKAGYSKKSAHSIGSENLQKPEIRDALEAAIQKVEDDAGVNKAFWLEAIKDVLQKCRQAEPVMEFNYVTKQLEPTGEWKFDSAGANAALRMIGQFLALFTDIKVAGTITLEQLIAGAQDPEKPAE